MVVTNFKKNGLLITALFVMLIPQIRAQVRILSSSFSSYNVSGESMCGINISNSGNEVNIVIEAKIINIQGVEIVKAVSNPLTVKGGVSNTLQGGLKIANLYYQNTSVSEFVKVYHQLPSGKYNYCVIVKVNDASEDELCEDIESEVSSFLTLVNPIDKDTIETVNPILIWNHSESFNVLQQGEYYRMIVTNLKPDQNAESAINVNTPILQQNFLNKHNVLYPYDAQKLVSGGRYAWQVQKVVYGIITNKTDAWEFVLRSKKDPVKMMVEITAKLNVAPYVVTDDKIYFKFKEEYSVSEQKLNAVITDTKGEELQLNVEDKKKNSLVKQISPNRYEADLRGLGLDEGEYVLKVYNEKKQAFLLKFSIR